MNLFLVAQIVPLFTGVVCAFNSDKYLKMTDCQQKSEQGQILGIALRIMPVSSRRWIKFAAV